MMCRCHRGKTASRRTGDFWSKSVLLLLAYLLKFLVFDVPMVFCFLKFVPVFGSLRTSLLCIIVELAGGASVAVAVGLSDR